MLPPPPHKNKNWFYGVGVSIDGAVRCVGNVYVRTEEMWPNPIGPVGITVMAESLAVDLFFPEWKLRAERYSEKLVDTVVMQHERGGRHQEIRFVFPSITAKNEFYELVKYS